MNAVIQLLRGEPVLVAGIVVAVAAVFGVQLVQEDVASLLVAVAAIVAAVLARGHTTPAANPSIPENAVPVRTLDGFRAPPPDAPWP